MGFKNRLAEPTQRAVHTGTDSKVQQQFADQCNINNVVKRFKKTGVLQSTIPSVHKTNGPVFGAYPHTDYQDMYLHVQQVREQFQALPAKIRLRFDNNPANLVRFVDDPANLREALKLGLTKLPEGYELDKAGNITEQQEIIPKADSEANPHMGEKGGGN